MTFNSFERIARKGVISIEELPKVEVMTPFTKEKLKKELVHLENQVEQTLLMIGEAGDRSDWHDNFALDQANRAFDF